MYIHMKKLSNEELSFFCMELSLLLHAGIGVEEGLRLLAEDTEDEGSRTFLTDIAEHLADGMSLAGAMRESGRFPDHVAGLVDMGEQSGRLEGALSSLARHCETRSRMERQIRSALLYPAILLLMMLVVIVVLLTQVLPVFNEVYASLGGQLTGVAGGLLMLGYALDRAMPVLCVLLALVIAFLMAFAAGGRFRDRVLALWDHWMGDRGASRAMHTARFAQALAMGLSSGLHMEEALDLAASLQGAAPAAQARCADCRERLDQGEDLAGALRQSGLLPPAACRMLALGQRSGTGDTVMEEIARRLSEEAEIALETRVSYVEPALVIVTSVLVGAILLSVMLPLMHIMAAIG